MPWLVSFAVICCLGGGERWDGERLALARTDQFGDQFTEVWPLDLFEPSSAILSGVVPGIGGGTDERARRLTVGEVDPVHGDDLVDDTGQLTTRLRALHLQRELRTIEFVDNLFEDADEDDVRFACVLQLMQPRQHLTRMQSVRAAHVLGAARSERFWLLFGVAKRQPAHCSDAVDENSFIAVRILKRAADALKMRPRVARCRRERRVWTANTARQIARCWPVVDANGGDRHVLHGEIAGLDIDK